MNCPHCANEMISAKATAFGESYLYCRTCKKELSELIVLESTPVSSAAPQSTHKWTRSSDRCQYCDITMDAYAESGGILECNGTALINHVKSIYYDALRYSIPGGSLDPVYVPPMKPPASSMGVKFAYPHDFAFSHYLGTGVCKKCGYWGLDSVGCDTP